jgi:hypothetical protein
MKLGQILTVAGVVGGLSGLAALAAKRAQASVPGGDPKIEPGQDLIPLAQAIASFQRLWGHGEDQAALAAVGKRAEELALAAGLPKTAQALRLAQPLPDDEMWPGTAISVRAWMAGTR